MGVPLPAALCAIVISSSGHAEQVRLNSDDVDRSVANIGGGPSIRVPDDRQKNPRAVEHHRRRQAVTEVLARTAFRIGQGCYVHHRG